MQAPAPSDLPVQQTVSQNMSQTLPYYDDNVVLMKTSDEAKIPVLLRLWDVTQFRYTNTLLGNSEYTDRWGAVRPVVQRNDFSLNRNLIQFVGHIFDKRLKFNLITWASKSSATPA